MKRYLTLAVAQTVALLVFAATVLYPGTTGKISGKVIDAKSRRALPGATVQIEGTKMGANTGPTGNYAIINVPPGKYSLKVQLVGYDSAIVKQLTVTADQTTTQNFELTAKMTQPDICQQVIAIEDLSQVFPSNPKQHAADRAASKLHPRGGGKGIPGSAPSIILGGFNAEYGSAYPPAHGGTTPPNAEPFDAMFFKNYGVNPFVSTEDDHLSTFAIDVDNASYSMTRAYLNRGYLPPEEAIRTEEFINNFKYNYRHPTEKAFSIVMEGAPSKFGANYQLLKIGIVGKKILDRNRKDANLVFVIDVSGSMARENRLGLVRKSLRMLLDNLTPRDRVGIVVYGSSAWIELEPTSVIEKDKIIAAIERLVSQGSTNAEAGIRLGYQMLDRIFEKKKINRIILCSDGVANVGSTGPEEILKAIKVYADKGITLSTIGFGMGNYNDILMEKLADKGNGSYSYVDNWTEVKRVFMENLTGMLQIIARDVKIQVDFDPEAVDRYRLLGYENRDVDDDKFRDDKEDGGEIGSGHQVTALYEIKLRNNKKAAIGAVYLRYKNPDSFEVSEVSRKINRRVFGTDFASASTDFRLAAATAEFSEILRKSYWAKKSELKDVLAVVSQIQQESSNDHVIELMNLISMADKLKQGQEGNQPLGMQTER